MSEDKNKNKTKTKTKTKRKLTLDDIQLDGQSDVQFDVQLAAQLDDLLDGQLSVESDLESDVKADLISSDDKSDVNSLDTSFETAENIFFNTLPIEGISEPLEITSQDDEDPLAILINEPEAHTELLDLEFIENNDGEQLADQQPQLSITDDEAISIMESLLFISDRPVGLTTFKTAFENTNIDTKKIKELINELKIDYVNTRRGVALEEIDGAYQLRTKSDNQDFIKKILKPKIFKLTGPSLETLAIVAYKQPCVKSQVDEIRGVESGHLIRALMDKGLVAFDGKSDFPGRPMLYKTTRKFLEIFGLRNLNELPSLAEMEEIITEGIGEDEDNKPTLSQLAGTLKENFEAQSYSIGEEELGKITEQLSGISTETEFFEVEKQKQKESRDRDRAEGLREALILGDVVDPKDEKWLQRYDQKMNQVLDAVPVYEEDIDEKVFLEKQSENSDLAEEPNKEDPLDLL